VVDVKVLMLGWEFPPHISGGLGTACLGLAEGLAQQGVDLTFVVPRALGDEDRRFARVIGANEVPVRRPGAPNEPGSWIELRDALGEVPGGLDEPGLTQLAARLRLLAVDSALVPYLSAEQYAARREALTATAEADVAAALAVLAGPGTGEGEREYLSFSGTYGWDLFAEVARYARVVEELARREPFDVVHAHDWMTYPAGIVAARVTGRPLVVHLHASEYDRSGENVNTAVRDIEQLGLEAADRVICVSHFLASVVRDRYGIREDKIRVVHNAVTQHEQLEQFHWIKAIDEPIVLFLGRVTFQKGPDYFLEAAARVVEVEPRIKFVISGAGDMLPQIMDQAAGLGLARHVHFTGFLRGRDVERMYAMADIYVMPSVSEPFGISPLEAMAADVPVIVSKQSGVSEVITHALKVDFWDVQDIANKILALLKYPELGTQLVEEGRQEVRRQRWDFRGRMVLDVYREVTT
jgi:glycogen synthase